MGWLDDLQENRVVGGLVHNAREWERDLDSDRDGSIADQIGRSMQDHVPIVGELLGQPLEDMGDCLTDVMGTRDQGIFSHAGTLDVENTTDTDYAKDGEYDPGLGQAINNATGLNIDPANPAALAIGSMTGGAGALGVVQNEVLQSLIPGMPSATEEAANWVRDVRDLEPNEI